jgi:carboxypeptidase C (cathepsin A)
MNGLKVAALFVLAPGLLLAQAADKPAPDAHPDQREKAPGVNVAALEATVVTHHSIKLGGKDLAYTAVVGGIVIFNDQKEPYHVMSYRAYMLDGADANKRPLTFIYNGGPGGSTATLNIGSFAPMRVLTKSPEPSGPPPYQVVQNEYTLLDQTDMVFVDAPATGFGHPVGKGTIKEIAGVDEDVAAFDGFVRRYVTVNNRWNSPKFLFGESYGTPRSAALAATLQSHGVECNGVILLSSVLNYNWRAAGLVNTYFGYLPTYAAIAKYFKLAGQDASSTEAWVDEARKFALTEYVDGLLQGNRLTDAQIDALAQKISHFTSLDVDYIKRSNLRIDPVRFRRELLRKQGLIIGRFDGRFARPEADAVGSDAGFDPTSTGHSGAYNAGFREYMQKDLKQPMDDFANSAPVNGIWDWNHKNLSTYLQPESQQHEPDTAADLGEAMRRNPALKVFSANGFYDLATPFTATEIALEGLPLSRQLQQNITFAYYPAGHMVYLNVDALKQFRADLRKFYESALQ